MGKVSRQQWVVRVMPALIMFLLAGVVQAQQAIPQIEGTTLSGHAMSLPHDLPPGLSILVIGFTRASGDSSKDWGRTLYTLAQNGGSFAYFQTPVMASVPRLIRGMVLGNIKKTVPASQQDRFLPVFDHEQQWQHAVSYTAPDDCYILVVNQQGIVRWQTHGPATPERVASLQQWFAHYQ